MKPSTNTTLETRDDIEIQSSKHPSTRKTTIYIHDRKSSDFISINHGEKSISNTSIELKVASKKSRYKVAVTQSDQLLIMCDRTPPVNTEEAKSKCGKIHGYRSPQDIAKMPTCVLKQLSQNERFERLKRSSDDTAMLSSSRFEPVITETTRKTKPEMFKKESDSSLFNAEYNFSSKNEHANNIGRSLMDSIRKTVNKFVMKEDSNVSIDNSDWDTKSDKQIFLDWDHLPRFPKETKNATIIPIAEILSKRTIIPCKFCQIKHMKELENVNTSFREEDSARKCLNKFEQAHQDVDYNIIKTNESVYTNDKSDMFKENSELYFDKSILASNIDKSKTSSITENNFIATKRSQDEDERSSIIDEDYYEIFQRNYQNSFGSFKNFEMIPCPRNLLCDQGLHSGRCHRDVRQRLSAPICKNNYCVCRQSDYFYLNDQKFWPCNFKTETSVSEACSRIGSAKVNENINDCSSKFFHISEMLQNVRFEDDEEEVLFSLGKEEDNYEDDKSTTTTITNNTTSTSNVTHCCHCHLNCPNPQTMNGMNGHHHHHHHMNGDSLNGSSASSGGDIITQNQQKGCWTIGLINSKFRYLTAETFGFKINANGASLKKKQIWTLEPVNSNSSDSLIYLRSHLDKYLAVDSFGNVTCESDEKDPGSKFQISVADDGSGRWALKNVVRGYFLGSSADKLACTAKMPGDAEFWHVHLAARPQMNLRSVGRKRFAHLSENLDEIHVDANIPWGEDTLFTLEFRLDESGKYAIHTCNNKYLSLGGKLIDQCTKDCLFSAEYHSGQLALRDRAGSYLSPIGSKAVLKTRSNTVTRDELFSLEDSLPQASFVANLNARFVSVKQGVDLTANQDEISDHETFQLEFDWSTKRWYIRTMQDRYWTLETGGGIQASGDKRSSNALFDLAWQQDGSVAFRANNGRYVITKRSGHLYATADTVEDNSKYYFYLINRPILVLKCEQGFVGYKSAASNKLECNKATYECIQVERGEKGVVYFKGQNGKYWHVDTEGVTADSDVQAGFYLELREPTRLCIKSTAGNYMTASKNGLFRLGDSGFESATLWEY